MERSKTSKRAQQRKKKRGKARQALLDAATTGDVSSLLRVLEAGASPRMTDSTGASALHLACIAGHAELVRRLVEDAGLDLASRDVQGRTPLMYAASTMGGDDVIKQMLTTGRAALSANAPEDLDIDNFLDGGTGHDVHEQAKKSKKKEKFASSLR